MSLGEFVGEDGEEVNQNGASGETPSPAPLPEGRMGLDNFEEANR